jgi:hypothetical protein
MEVIAAPPLLLELPVAAHPPWSLLSSKNFLGFPFGAKISIEILSI